jgi:hypothetical protein
MGAKFTIVLDTDDPQGLRDALEIATILNRNHGGSGAQTVEFTRISLIKLVRTVAREVENKKMDSSLRDCKSFVDERWNSFVTKTWR